MKKLLNCLFPFFCLLLTLTNFQPTFADATACQGIGIQATFDPSQPIPEGHSFTVTFSSSNGLEPGNYQFKVGWGKFGDAETAKTDTQTPSNGSIKLTMSDSHVLDNNTHVGTLYKDGQEYCGYVSYKVGYQFSECQISFRPATITTQQPFQIDVQHAPKGSYDIYTAIAPSEVFASSPLTKITIDEYGNGTSADIPAFTSPQTYNVRMYRLNTPLSGEFCGQTSLVVKPIGQGKTIPIPPPDTSKTDGGGGQTGEVHCISEKGNPNSCTSGGGMPCPDGNPGIFTAIGCVPTTPKALIQALMGFAAGIGGGIALLLMIFGSFQMMTSSGNPEAIKKGREQFVAAVLGLLFIIFSALLLKIIGVDILNIPGFS